ncbi:MAG: Hpt domain-containing protein [Candidatus Poseidoniia archaeon]|jgi:HPt (histidine-containing phosphotransfer) domain-containing protein|nr:Hpt domain-containing protein [Candidatus Poseidoniia archaeon]MDP7095928.1 Hpt domain-containing protein [Candidatus Poseidoniia archaeon]MDP7444115.1 Hpt domain-containing protein [Candidatus Poseidoniia archaeon]|tara:strand:+ start:209 stop:487 length:279 start_codon:yes stop_codon:yes gene_type:complete
MDDFDDDEWAEMQEMYINHTFKELKNIKENLDSATFDSLRTFGHNIKGSGGMYGFNEITSMGAKIESAAINENLEDIKSHLDALGVFLKSKL